MQDTCAVFESPIPTFDYDSEQDVTIATDLATLKEKVDNNIKFFWGVVAFGFVWLGAVSLELWTIHGQLADGGNTKLITELKTPKSPEQLRANLSMVSAEIQTARANGTKPDAKKVQALSSALSQVVQRNPSLPEAWQTAFQIVSYRSEPIETRISGDLPNCLSDPHALDQFRNTLREYGGNPEAFSTGFFYVRAKDCTLDLDANYAYESTPGWQFLKEVNEKFPGTGNRFQLKNVIIIYSGGRLIPLDTLECTGCVFKLNTPSAIPPKEGQEIANQLLTADLAQVNVNLRSGL